MTEQNGTQPPGFMIGGEFYPTPTSFRLGDPVLVTELTGVSWVDFIARIDDQENNPDPMVMLGIVGVAVWQRHPTWRRDQTVAFVQRLAFDAIEAVGMDDETPEGDAGPPAGSGEPISTSSPAGSNGSPASTSPNKTPPTSGQPASTTGAPA